MKKSNLKPIDAWTANYGPPCFKLEGNESNSSVVRVGTDKEGLPNALSPGFAMLCGL